MKVLAFSLLVIFWIALSKSYTVVTEDYPPYNYEENGILKGIGTELVQEILFRAKIDYELKLYPWARAYKMALEKEGTMIFSITFTEQRKDLFKWVGPLLASDADLIAKKSSMIKINSYKDLENYKIGVVKDDIGEQLLLENGVPANNLETVAIPMLNFKKLAIDRVDMLAYEGTLMGWLLRNTEFNYEDYEVVYKMQKGELFLGMHVNTPDDVVKKCQKALDEMKTDGTYTKIVQKYTR
ncbi:MAG: transporter substrate-binding domain-containing protein [Candidatus Delongbacteria bacterium]|nr:transporter substrate-binding domain-containing protein [Candidatus Delongbacteria bacterium]MBN2834009.1 transporter substrate-binding domain-containing protein [Candidatus Delongbacteria bacterium]